MVEYDFRFLQLSEFKPPPTPEAHQGALSSFADKFDCSLIQYASTKAYVQTFFCR